MRERYAAMLKRVHPLEDSEHDATTVRTLYRKTLKRGGKLGKLITQEKEDGTKSAINGGTEPLKVAHFRKEIGTENTISKQIEGEGFIMIAHAGTDNEQCQAFAARAQKTYEGMEFEGTDFASKVRSAQRAQFQRLLEHGGWMFVELSGQDPLATTVLIHSAMVDLMAVEAERGALFESVVSHSLVSAAMGNEINTVANERTKALYSSKQMPLVASLPPQIIHTTLTEEQVAEYSQQEFAKRARGAWKVPTELNFGVFLGRNNIWRSMTEGFQKLIGTTN